MPEPHAVLMDENNPSLPCKQQDVFLQGPWASGNCKEAKQLVPVSDQAWFVGWLYSVPGMLHPTTASAHFSHTEKGAVPLASLIWREENQGGARLQSGRGQLCIISSKTYLVGQGQILLGPRSMQCPCDLMDSVCGVWYRKE